MKSLPFRKFHVVYQKCIFAKKPQIMEKEFRLYMYIGQDTYHNVMTAPKGRPSVKPSQHGFIKRGGAGAVYKLYRVFQKEC